MKTIVVPDIHGRTFWKELKTKYKDFEGKIVFLGDYVDHYSYEDISWNDTIKNFIELIDFARNNSNVILLIGNHDYHYIWDFGTSTRFSRKHYKELHKLYTDNIDLFKLSYYDEQNDILYSHAGVLQGWLDVLNIDIKDINDLMIERPYDIWKVSEYRGGMDKFGSIIWADLREHMKYERINDHTIQIFGHTQLNSDYEIIHDNIYCVDSKQLFIVNGRTINLLK